MYVKGVIKVMIMDKESKTTPRAGVSDLSIAVVYDNNPHKDGLESAWGFSCLITTAQKNILFDTGGDGSLLLNNMEKLAIDPNKIDIVVLSHIHGDHTGGLAGFLQRNPKVTVYLPKSFSGRFKDNVRSYGSKIVEVEQFLKVCEDVYSIGELGRWIKEQSLIIRTKAGMIIIIGCAHPGIINIVNATKGLLRDNILLIMGGCHLEWVTKGKIEKIVFFLGQWQVCYIAPCDCSGDKARNLFKKHFGKNYINTGVGKVITMMDLQ